MPWRLWHNICVGSCYLEGPLRSRGPALISNCVHSVAFMASGIMLWVVLQHRAAAHNLDTNLGDVFGTVCAMCSLANLLGSFLGQRMRLQKMGTLDFGWLPMLGLLVWKLGVGLTPAQVLAKLHRPLACRGQLMSPPRWTGSSLADNCVTRCLGLLPVRLRCKTAEVGGIDLHGAAPYIHCLRPWSLGLQLLLFQR